MKKVYFLLLSTLIGLTSFFVSYSDVMASELSQLSIRPDRLQAATHPGRVLVTATTDESVLEDQLKVVAGNAWSLDNSVSNFTVSTLNLPSGVTAWPGINTATSLSGKEITFPSANLAAGTQYGFYITGGIVTNPSAGDGADYVWNVSTYASGSLSSDSDAMVSINDSDQIVVSAEVAVLASYFDLSLESLEQAITFEQNQVIDYQITYGSTYAQSTPLIIEASWDQGTIEGDPTPSVDVLAYVVGSASQAYQATAPVVDLNEKTITWSVTSFPANLADQTVSFQLKTTNQYTQTNNVNFSVSARMTSPVVTADSVVSGTYRYVIPPVEDKTYRACGEVCNLDGDCQTNYCHPVTKTCREKTNPNDSACQKVSSSSSAPADPVEPPVTISSIIIDSISTTAVTFHLNLSGSSPISVNYGTHPGSLNQQIVFSDSKNFHQLTIDGLTANKTYYLQFQSAGADSFVSDIFRVKTAQANNQIKLKKDTLIVSGGRNILWNEKENCLDEAISCLPTIKIPVNVNHEISFSLDQHQLIKDINLIMRRSNNIGASETDLFNENSYYNLVETFPGTYQAYLTSPADIGNYDIILKTVDIYGNINNQPLLVLSAVHPIQILDHNKQPIEKARVHFYKFNEKTKLYDLLMPGSLVIANPLKTDYKGQLLVVLPEGKYKIKVDSLGYVTQTQEFRISAQHNDNYPEITLLTEHFLISNFITYHTTTVFDSVVNFKTLIKELILSHRVYQASLIGAMLLFIILIPLALSARTHIPLLELPKHFSHLFDKKFLKKGIITGKIINAENKLVLAGVQILILESKDNKVVATTRSDNKGYFRFKIGNQALKLQVIKKGFLESTVELTAESFSKENSLVIELTTAKTISQNVIEKIKGIINNLLSLSLEMIIILSLLFTILFIFSFGITKVYLLLIFSFFNLILSVFYLTSQNN